MDFREKHVIKEYNMAHVGLSVVVDGRQIDNLELDSAFYTRTPFLVFDITVMLHWQNKQ